MLAEATTANRNDVIAALQRASAATGSDFNYLLNTAMRESSLKPQAQSNTSSAAGLFQFVEQTWLGMVKEHGAQYGLGQYANAITKGSDGRYHTANNTDRQAILALRNDPQTAAYMEGEYAQASRLQLQNTLGRNVCGGELYAAHFLGNDAACRLIQMAQNNPNASAASAFPAAAGANHSVFYNTDGSSKSVRDVYNWAISKHGDAPVSFKATTAANDTGSDAADATPGKIYLSGGNGSTDARLAAMEFNMLAPSWMSSMGGNDSGDDTTSIDGSVPHKPFMMTPGVIDLLNTMSPANTSKVADRRAAS